MVMADFPSRQNFDLVPKIEIEGIQIQIQTQKKETIGEDIGEDRLAHSGGIMSSPRTTLHSAPSTLDPAASTPPLDTDTTRRLRFCTMDTSIGTSTNSLHTLNSHNGDAMTPPATPTEFHQCRVTAPTNYSYFPPTPAAAVGPTSDGKHKGETTNLDEEPGGEDLKVFPYWITDYEMGPKGKRTLLGSGLWSDVYLAPPKLNHIPTLSLTQPTSPSSSPATTPTRTTSTVFNTTSDLGITTPPPTPIHSRESSFSSHSKPSHLLLDIGVRPQPATYAIKLPASRTSKAILTTEARTLTYLTRFPSCSTHIVPFYGQDTRNDALVLRKMDMTLEAWVKTNLNTLSDEDRNEELARTFPRLGRELAESLQWLGEKGVVHADIKPGNILISLPSEAQGKGQRPTAVYSDFSSSITLASSPLPNGKKGNGLPLGGGTWDFLHPSLLSTNNPAEPSTKTDIWALALTLLYIIIGGSPFDCAGTNVFRRRDCVKQGTPMAFVGCGDEGVRNMRRLRGLGKKLGWDVWAWLGAVLGRERGSGRGDDIGVEEWRDMMGE